MVRRLTGFAGISVCMALACGGANPTGDLGIVIPGGDVSGEVRDVPAGPDAVRDAPVADTIEPPADGIEPQDPGTPTDPGTLTDPGTVDHGTSDPGTLDPGYLDPGYLDPGTPDPGTEYDSGGVGGCDPCGMGTVAGKTCAPNIKTAVGGVKVWVDTIDCSGNPVHIETHSNQQGEYTMQVPCGTQTINMLKGNFGGSYTRWIDKGKVTTMTSADACLSGTLAKIAVITGDWDEIENTLLLLWLHFTKIAGAAGEEGQTNQTAINFLKDWSKLSEYDILFLNCSDAGWPNMQSGEAGQIRANLKAFVAKGGSVYASDYALPYLSETWPGYILGGGWSAAGNSTYLANVVDPDLAAYVGKSQVSIKYGLGPLTCVTGIGANTFLSIDSTKPISGCSGTQMMMSFEPETNGGRVIYTTFHNDEQPKTGSDMQMILEFLVFLM